MKIKDIVKQCIGQKFLTTMIYPLDQFEQDFGYIWGHGKKDSELTDEEKVNREKWLDLRDRVLDKGNQQKRNALKELAKFNITQPVFHTKFLPGSRK